MPVLVGDRLRQLDFQKKSWIHPNSPCWVGVQIPHHWRGWGDWASILSGRGLKAGRCKGRERSLDELRQPRR